MVEAVLDASALLALLNAEPGSAAVRTVVQGSWISAVNLCEVVGKLADIGMPSPTIHAVLSGLGFRVAPFDERQAYEAGLLRSATKSAGLSLGDRACLALARSLGAVARTADIAWRQVSAGVAIQFIR